MDWGSSPFEEKENRNPICNREAEATWKVTRQRSSLSERNFRNSTGITNCSVGWMKHDTTAVGFPWGKLCEFPRGTRSKSRQESIAYRKGLSLSRSKTAKLTLTVIDNLQSVLADTATSQQTFLLSLCIFDLVSLRWQSAFFFPIKTQTTTIILSKPPPPPSPTKQPTSTGPTYISPSSIDGRDNEGVRVPCLEVTITNKTANVYRVNLHPSLLDRWPRQWRCTSPVSRGHHHQQNSQRLQGQLTFLPPRSMATTVKVYESRVSRSSGRLSCSSPDELSVKGRKPAGFERRKTLLNTSTKKTHKKRQRLNMKGLFNFHCGGQAGTDTRSEEQG